MRRPPPLAYPSTPPTSSSDLPSAGEGSLPPIWRRFVARLIDTVAIAVPAFIAIVMPHLAFGSTDEALRNVPASASIAAAVIPVVYEFVMTVFFGATLGKMALGLRIVSFADGSHPRPYQMGLRVMIPAAPSLLSLAALPALLSGALSVAEFIVYSTALYSAVLRGIHDLGAGTIILRDG